jgi:3-oxoacyl-[acyl-carrier-protein] synthase-1
LSGIARPKELGYFTVVDPELQEPQGVVGHPIEALTEGFHLFGLWLRVGIKCLEDLLGRAAATLGDSPRGAAPLGPRVALIAVTPDIRSARFMSEGDESADALRAPYLDRLAKRFGISPALTYAVPAGSTGVFAAIETADALLAEGRVDRVVVLAVDSLLDTLSLDWLASAHRLKSVSAPTGLMPGEGGAALLLERPGGSGLGVTVRAVAAETHTEGELTSAARGARLARVLRRCLDRSAVAAGVADGAALAGVADAIGAAGAGSLLVSDQNGEQWRAEEMGYCGLHLADRWPARAEIVLPALSVGDTGAAGATLGCCIGALALKYPPAAARESVVVASTIEGSAGAALLAVAH